MELTLGTYQKNIMAVDLPHNIVDNTDKSESPAELGAEDIGELAITDPIEFEKIMNGDKDA